MKIGQRKEMVKKYKNIWLLLIDITASEGKKFIDLIDVEDGDNEIYLGAWANVLIKADTLKQALKIVPQGLQELGFIIKEIDTKENLQYLVDKSAVEENVIFEADWLLSSEYVFMISDKLFPYLEI